MLRFSKRMKKRRLFFEKHNNKDEDTDGLSDGSAEGNL